MSLLDGHAADRAADAIVRLLNEGAPMPTPASENANHRDEVIDRLHQLGADDDMIAAVREADADTIERLRRANDHMLATEIQTSREAVEANDDDAWITEGEIDVEDDEAPLTEEEKDAAAQQLLDVAEDDDAVIAAVGPNAELAARIFRLEAGSGDPSPGLLEAVARVAGIDYQAPATAPVEAEAIPEAPEPSVEVV